MPLINSSKKMFAGTCNFDTDICTFTNVQNSDDFDWIRNSGATGSTNTGPTQDHTHGNAQGQCDNHSGVKNTYKMKRDDWIKLHLSELDLYMGFSQLTGKPYPS